MKSQPDSLEVRGLSIYRISAWGFLAASIFLYITTGLWSLITMLFAIFFVLMDIGDLLKERCKDGWG
jgi:hypothetical protein